MRRAYCTLSDGKQLHFRVMGEGPPLILLHPSPQHSEAMIPAMSAFSEFCTCIALDTPGYGLSDGLDIAEPTLGDYASKFVEAMDALGIEKACVYGAATGAQVAIEMSKLFPERVAFVLLDSNGELSPEETAEYIANGYFADVAPRRDGGHLLTYWDMCRNLFRAFPWYSEEPQHQLGLGTPPVEMIHATLLRYLLAGENYADAYRPAFYAENVEHMAGMDVPATMTRWESSPVLALADTLIDRGLPANIELLRAGHGLDARYGVQVEALAKHLAAHPLDAFAIPETSPGGNGRRFLDSAVGLLHVHVRAGEGRPLVALHGAGQSAEGFLEDIEVAVEGRAVWAFDLPHHGASPDLPSETPTTPETLAGPIIEALRNEGLSDIDVLASGIGASVALELAKALDLKTIQLVRSETLEAAQREEGIARGLPDLAPRIDGTHLIAAWDFARARRVFWPPWDVSAEGQREQALDTDPQAVHLETAEMLRVGAHWREFMAMELRIDWDALAARDGVTMIEA